MLMDNKKEFEEPKNAAVGAIVDRTAYIQPHWTKQVDEKQMEYGFDYGKQCSYAILIDKVSRRILSWRYVSEPQLCWRHWPTA